jgi:hypothetical protein
MAGSGGYPQKLDYFQQSSIILHPWNIEILAIFVVSEKFEVNFGLTVEEKGVIWDN